jgi:hypothetical protein
VDQDLKAYLDERFTRIDERFTGIDARFDRLETEVRHTRVLVESVQDSVRLLAEGVVGTGERIDTLREQTLGSLVEVKGSIDTIHNHLIPRVAALEAKAARENRDVLEVLRERLGLHAPLRRSAP